MIFIPSSAMPSQAKSFTESEMRRGCTPELNRAKGGTGSGGDPWQKRLSKTKKSAPAMAG